MVSAFQTFFIFISFFISFFHFIFSFHFFIFCIFDRKKIENKVNFNPKPPNLQDPLYKNALGSRCLFTPPRPATLAHRAAHAAPRHHQPPAPAGARTPSVLARGLCVSAVYKAPRCRIEHDDKRRAERAVAPGWHVPARGGERYGDARKGHREKQRRA